MFGQAQSCLPRALLKLLILFKARKKSLYLALNILFQITAQGQRACSGTCSAALGRAWGCPGVKGRPSNICGVSVGLLARVCEVSITLSGFCWKLLLV